MNASKGCPKCQRILPLTDFYRNRTKASGYASYCKECTKSVKAKYQQEHTANVTAASQRWRAKNKVRAREISRVYRERNRDKKKAYHRWYDSVNPEKTQAHRAVKKAIKAGKLPPIHSRTCTRCGETASYYHHEDYSKQLEVIPLCGSCHQYVHLERKSK